MDRLNLQLTLAQTLACTRELRSPLFELARVVNHHRLDLCNAAGRNKAVLEQIVIALKIFLLQSKRALHLSDLRTQSESFLLDALALRSHQSHFGGERMAARFKQRRLLQQRLLDALIVPRRSFELAGKDQLSCASLFRLEPDQRGTFDIERGKPGDFGRHPHPRRRALG